MRLAERAAEHREVLAEHEHQPAVHGPPAGHHAVARDLLLGHPEIRGAVLHEHVPFLERAGIEQQVDTLAGGQLALLVLGLDPLRTTAQSGAVAHVLEPLDDVLHVGPPGKTARPGYHPARKSSTNFAASANSRRRPRRRCSARSEEHTSELQSLMRIS